MNRVDIINGLIQKHNYKSYLEIGIQKGDCFRAIICDLKVGVDPDKSSAATIHQTSDDFFAENQQKFEICFIDGMHHSDFVERDILNALNALTPNGTIVMHDCLPHSKEMQEIPLTNQIEWTGDTWKAFVRMRIKLVGKVGFWTCDTDYGCGILRPSDPNPLVTMCLPSIDQELTYEGFLRNRDCWMNVISVAKFKHKFLD